MLKHGFQPLKKKKIAIAYFNITSLYRKIKKKKSYSRNIRLCLKKRT